jgi:hypothetical protein
MKTHRFVLLLITVLGLLAYVNSLNGSFHFDDLPPIVENPLIQDLGNLPLLLASSRGVVMATFALNYAISGIDVFGYHLFNTGLHILNAILVYFILVFALTDNNQAHDAAWSQRIAAFTAFLFVVHPIQTQAVSYIVQRFEVMASTFYLLGLVFFVVACRAQGKWQRVGLMATVIVVYLIGLKSKEIAVTLPVALLLFDFCFVSRGQSRAMLQRWALHSVLLVICIFYVISTLVRVGGRTQIASLAEQGQVASAGFAVKSVTAWEYFLTQTNVLLHYISLLVYPAQQNLDYDFPVAHSLWQTPILADGAILNAPLLPPFIALLVLLALVVSALFLLRKSALVARLTGFCVLMFFLVLAPTSSFVPIVDLINDHRAYLASAFFLVLPVLFFDWLGGRLSTVFQSVSAAKHPLVDKANDADN